MADSLVKLTLPELEGGRALDEVNRAIEQACADVIVRPYNGDAREVTLKVRIVPEMSTGQNMPEISWKVGTSFPGVAGSKITAMVQETQDGEMQVQVNTWSKDPRQPALPGVENERPGNVTKLSAQG